MMAKTVSVKWWRAKRASFADERLQEEAERKSVEEGERKRIEQLRNRQIKKKMGTFQYDFNIPKRNKYIAQVQR